MLSSSTHDLTGPKLIIFGSQTLSLDSDAAALLRTDLLHEPQLKWVREVLGDLPNLWKQIPTPDSMPQQIPHVALLSDLSDWLDTGIFSSISFPLPNAILTPLVVITHLIEYYKLLRNVSPASASRTNIHKVLTENSEILGLCTGILTATVVSCSRTIADIEKYGSIAIRLAMLIGASVDAKEMQNTLHGPSGSYLVSWRPPLSAIELKDILDRHPDAYVSVRVDDDRSTVTMSNSSAGTLQEQLVAAGFMLTPINLHGCFHCQCQVDSLGFVLQLCDKIQQLQLPDADMLLQPVRTDTEGKAIQSSDGKLHEVIARSMLVEQPDWPTALNTSTSDMLHDESSLLICIGSECYIPKTISQALSDRIIQAASLHHETVETSLDGVAVIGMSCQAPGADDIEEFWTILNAGKSQHVPVSEQRFDFETPWRQSQSQQWYGNFLNNNDSFDHKFFRKSPREIAETDPQHRLMLQTAYQAVEQSGYFNYERTDKHVGCYIGVANADYEKNVNCYAPNAFSATGNLKSFTSGKINHYFGWTGPSLTIDTACSSSAVAVHYACRAILTGECRSALAGGVNIITTPEWFQNLAGASFLSPTGQCKPFDSEADGYCRGEGVGAVFLKSLSSAIQDGDQIFGVIKASAVYQNENCTPITVPNSPSLSNLFQDVVQQAGFHSSQISYVEAHAAGTLVGDPAEYKSISKVFGGAHRSDILHIGSAKGVIGHAECASGILALIKTLTMIQKKSIPPQAGLQKLNPALHVTSNDKVGINTNSVYWNAKFRAALVNNFGASGSNACLLITQGPILRHPPRILQEDVSSRYPFMICGFDARSIEAYCRKLRNLLQISEDSATLSIPNLSFQLSRQTNRNLSTAFVFTCASIDDFKLKLQNLEKLGIERPVLTRQPPRPVVLCFGGQVSTYIGLDSGIYERSDRFRHHLDECNKASIALGSDGIYPHIFDAYPIEDIVNLQTALFSIQYACARTWIDCGIEVAAVVGLSFGELAALCISGALSLQDAMKLVVGRATIIKERWGYEKGAMVAAEGTIEDIQRLVLEVGTSSGKREPICIACHTGPRNFTLAGSTRAIEQIMDLVKSDTTYASTKCQRLEVTHAFHSALADPVLPDLKRLAESVSFRQPTIRFERAAEEDGSSKLPLTSTFVLEHTRRPSFYNDAVQRLAKEYPSSIWLEAGSNTSIAALTRRALGSPSGCYFQSIDISKDNSFSSLADAISSLWREGLNCSFWPHHSSQTSDYSPATLPPYQFERQKHWMNLKKAPKECKNPEHPPTEASEQLWVFLGCEGKDRRLARFRINTKSTKYLSHIQGHKVAQAAPICSSTVQVEIAFDTIMSLRQEFKNLEYRPELCGMKNMVPMVLDHSREFVLSAKARDLDGLSWDWEIYSTKANTARSLHTSGVIAFRAATDVHLAKEFAKYERLIPRQSCVQLLSADDSDEIMQGKGIYKAFRDVLEYGDMYKGLKKFVSKNNESAGQVQRPWDGDSWINSGLLDSFCQVAGMHVNNDAKKSDDEMYISNGIDQFLRSPNFYSSDMRSDTWEVYANNHRLSPKDFISDVFIFDARKGVLAEVIIGIRYIKTSKTGLGKMLRRLTPGPYNDPVATPFTGRSRVPSTMSSPRSSDIQLGISPRSSETQVDMSPTPLSDGHLTKQSHTENETAASLDTTPDIQSQVQDIISQLSGLDSSQISQDSSLEDLGIDSLMGMELAREIEVTFNCSFSAALIVDFPTVSELVNYLKTNIGGNSNQ